jgi:hypothetical protein
MDVEKLKSKVAAYEKHGIGALNACLAIDADNGELPNYADLARSVIALTEDLAARDKAHECDAQIAADLIAGEQAKRYEVEAERDKLRAALVEIGEIAFLGRTDDAYSEGDALRAIHDRIAALAQATQETSNAMQEEKRDASTD